ncbi:MAG: cyclase family protein [Alphaproteobacteria bacterium]|nr:cyclase family protein [Alphaproteobacteria bacterium]
MKLIDLTHVFSANMPVYPGDSSPELKQTAFIAAQGYNSYGLRGGMHVGTHMDAPLHMIPDGAFMSDIPVTQFFGRGRLVDARGRAALTEDLLDNVALEAGDVVLVLTGRHKLFRSPEYYESFPQVTPSFAERLVSAGVSILGLDTPSPDSPPFSVHKILLSNNVLIVENLNDLELLLGTPEFEVFAVPSKYQCEAAPVRVIARVRENT